MSNPYSSTDGGETWHVQRWLSFGGKTAEAEVAVTVNDCTPACVSGHYKTATARVLFKHVIRCRRGYIYGEAVIERSTDSSVAESGEKVNLGRELDC